MNTFLSEEELKQLGIKTFGCDVLIGKHVVIYEPDKLCIGNHVRIDDFTIISGNIILKNYIHISHFCGLYGGDSGIVMEDFSGLSSKCSVYADSDDYSGYSMTNPTIPIKYRPQLVSAPVLIEKHVILGCSSVVLPGVTIKEGTAVGSMSLCNKTTESWAIYSGIPAKKKGIRKQEILTLEQEFLRDTNEM